MTKRRTSPKHQPDSQIPDQPGAGLKPRSASSFGSSFVALVLSLLLLVVLQRHFPDQTHYNVAAACGLLVALIVLSDLLVRKVYRRESAGLSFRDIKASPPRVIRKLLALAATLGVLAFGYWLFPEYHGSFYEPFWTLLSLIGPWLLALAIPYFWLIDGAQTDAEDSYAHLGDVLCLRARPDGRVLARHFGGWVVKGFFLPLMVVYLTRQVDIATLDTHRALNHGGVAVYDLFYNGIFLIDVMFAAIGYCMTFRLFDTHIRTVEPTGLGWGVALVCYQPFWSLINRQYLNYDNGFFWGEWLAAHAVFLTLWGGLIIVLLGIYVLSTISFGVRFSNLTHRGIITSGPYRFTKHPAYLAKNTSWWLISVPFISSGGLADALRACVLIGFVNIIYLARAKTEERHLRWDPVYREYSAWIAEHGLFAILRRWLARLFSLGPAASEARTEPR
jgi:protein-S-isoprenylcysteine O-methyltransferase Ste14